MAFLLCAVTPQRILDKSSKSASIRPSVIIVPARFFHAEYADCPSATETADAVTMIRLVVEERAPLPMEQLVSGVRRGGEKIAAFVGVKKRLDTILLKESETAAHLIPESVLPLPATTGFSGWRWFSAVRGSLVAIKTGDSASLPVAVRGFTAPDDVDDAALLSLKKQYESRMSDAPHEAGVWRLDDILRMPKGGVRFTWSNAGESGATGDSFLSQAEFDLADLREPQAVATLRRGEQTAARLTTATRAIFIAMAALVVLQVGLWGMRGVARWRESRLESSRAEADRAEAEATLLSTLDRVTERRLPALERLATLNISRPDSVTLTRATFTDGEVRATGTAKSMGDLNTWISVLRKEPAFSAVETPSIRSASDRTTFELRITAKPGVRR